MTLPELEKLLKDAPSMVPADAWEHMQRLNGEPEAAHRMADSMLMKSLMYLGQANLVQAYIDARERNKFRY